MKKISKIFVLTLCCLLVATSAFAKWQNLGTNVTEEGIKSTFYMDDDVQDCGDYCTVKIRAELVGAPLISKITGTLAYKLNQVGGHKEVDATKSQPIDFVCYNASDEEIPMLSQHRQYSADAWNSETDQNTEEYDNVVAKFYDQKYNSIFSNKIMWGAIGGVVLLVILGLVIKSKKKNDDYQYYDNNTSVATPVAAPVTQQNYATPPAPTVLTFVGYKGCFKGMTMPVHKFPAKIGRDTGQCKIQFPEGTEGISRVHCTIYENNGTFTVVDSSTYGTFVNGQKLSGNSPVRLNNGDYIAFGSSNEVFSVKF